MRLQFSRIWNWTLTVIIYDIRISCALPSLDRKTTGTGSSRRVAEQQAARNALKELGVEDQ